ncbi:MAG: tetratricopeptide repeat protein [Planctomycetes bacterium]|nr:tetratricopeptide repeat protein [Planctomycetota bacterium]
MQLPAEALPYAKKAAELQPSDTNVLDTYGWTLFLNKQYGEAAGTLLRAIDIEGDRVPDKLKSADVRYHLGVLYKQQGKLEDAQAMLEAASRLCESQDRRDELPKKIATALEEVGKSAQ